MMTSFSGARHTRIANTLLHDHGRSHASIRPSGRSWIRISVRNSHGRRAARVGGALKPAARQRDASLSYQTIAPVCSAATDPRRFRRPEEVSDELVTRVTAARSPEERQRSSDKRPHLEFLQLRRQRSACLRHDNENNTVATRHGRMTAKKQPRVTICSARVQRQDTL